MLERKSVRGHTRREGDELHEHLWLENQNETSLGEPRCYEMILLKRTLGKMVAQSGIRHRSFLRTVI
jgi:hypothetical protein